MPRLSNFIVASDVVELFGGEGGTRSMLVEKYCLQPCGVCGRNVTFDTDTPASVVVTIHDQGMGPIDINLVHPGCSASGVVLVLTAPTPTGQLPLPAMPWLREGQPPSVLVLAPRVPVRTIAGDMDVADVVVSGLRDKAGFTPLTTEHTTLDEIPGWVHVTFTSGQRITITTDAGTTLYDGHLPMPDGWAELVQVTGLLGIVVVSGLDLHDPDRHHIADLHAAIARGAAVGVTMRADPGPRVEPIQPSKIPALPPDQDTRR